MRSVVGVPSDGAEQVFAIVTAMSHRAEFRTSAQFQPHLLWPVQPPDQMLSENALRIGVVHVQYFIPQRPNGLLPEVRLEPAIDVAGLVWHAHSGQRRTDR
jgi:hypothetical protein